MLTSLLSVKKGQNKPSSLQPNCCIDFHKRKRQEPVLEEALSSQLNKFHSEEFSLAAVEGDESCRVGHMTVMSG